MEYNPPGPYYTGIKYSLEVKNTGTVPVHEISLRTKIYTLDGEQIGFFFENCHGIVLQPNQTHSFTVEEISIPGINNSTNPLFDDLKNNIDQILKTDLNELKFDFSIKYSVFDGPKE